MNLQARRKLVETVRSVTRRGSRYVVRGANGRVIGAIISRKDLERLERAIEDEQDVRDSLSRLNDPDETPVPYERARMRLKLR